MPVPIFPVIAALTAGGSLVPHAAGGLIVTSATGYVAGTYLTSAAVSSLLASIGAALGVGVLTVTGVAGALIGNAGIFGTTVGASGLTGVLMSVGVLPATPIIVPIAIGAAGITGVSGAGYLTYLLLKLRRKLRIANGGAEVLFSEREAKIIEAIIRQFAKKNPSNRASRSAVRHAWDRSKKAAQRGAVPVDQQPNSAVDEAGDEGVLVH